MSVINVIISELTNRKLKNEERLQRIINSKDEDVNLVVNKTINILTDIVTIDSMITKWVEYTTVVDKGEGDNNNN